LSASNTASGDSGFEVSSSIASLESGLAREIADHEILLHRRVVDERELLDAHLVLRERRRAPRRHAPLEDLDEVAVEGGLDLGAVLLDLRHRLEEDLLLGARGRGFGEAEQIVLDLVERVGEDAAQLGTRQLAALAEERLALRRRTGAGVGGDAGAAHGRVHTRDLWSEPPSHPRRGRAGAGRADESLENRASATGGRERETRKPQARCCLCCSCCGDPTMP
jgi:hypothetical protein